MNTHNELTRARVSRNAWKASLTKEIIHLEDNLDQIYYTAGLKPHRIVREEEQVGDDGAIIDNEKGITQPELRDYESIIDEQVNEIDQAADNICALISSVTEFDLPIPVLVLLKLANRTGSIRTPDFKKKVPGTMAKKYIYNTISLKLISSSLNLYKWISTVLSTNILPFQPFVNQNIFSLLAWTKTSNLFEHDVEKYYTIRIQTLAFITRMSEHLSLNLNLDSNQLKTLVEEELIDGLDQLISLRTRRSEDQTTASNSSNSLPLTNGYGSEKRKYYEQVNDEESIENQYACRVLECLDRVFIVYADFLEAKLELKLKNFIIQTCIRIYRDFDQNVIGLACRRQLLRLLETISNRPFATSTTELAWHVFELCDKLETDPEIRYIARRSIKTGLAHRPTIVSHFDVHDCYANKCDIGQQGSEILAIKPIVSNGNAGEIGAAPESTTEEDESEPLEKTKEMDVERTETSNTSSCTHRTLNTKEHLLMDPSSPSDDGKIANDDFEGFDDGYDENLLGDDEDKRKLAQMTENERKQELFNRSERRETLKMRFIIEKKLRAASKRRESESNQENKHASSQDKFEAGTNGHGDANGIMADGDERDDDRVESVANGPVSESDKSAVVEHQQVDKQDDDKVDGVSDKQIVETCDKADESGDDDQVKPYLDLFVDSLVPLVTPTKK